MRYIRRLSVVVGTLAFAVATFSGDALAAHDSKTVPHTNGEKR